MNQEINRYRFLDIGGGAEWENNEINQVSLEDDINSLRAVKLAKENPDKEYIVFDQFIPTNPITRKANETPNLHFVKGETEYLPFDDASIDRVEMNHMYAPLSMGEDKIRYSEVPDDVTPYLNTLKEACRVLKPDGVLALTEKQERFHRIHRLLPSRMKRLGLNYKPQANKIVTDPNRTIWTGIAMTQKKEFEEKGDVNGADNYTVFTLELRKNYGCSTQKP